MKQKDLTSVLNLSLMCIPSLYHSLTLGYEEVSFDSGLSLFRTEYYTIDIRQHSVSVLLQLIEQEKY